MKWKTSGKVDVLRVLMMVIIGTAIVITVILLSRGVVRAGQEVSLQGSTLIIKEISSIKYVNDVPSGLSASVAGELVTGRLEKAVIEEKGKTVYSFGFPWVKAETTFLNKTVRYLDGWSVTPIKPKIEEGDDYVTSFFWLWIPAFLIVLVSVVAELRKTGPKGLLFFYATMFLSVLVGVFVGGLSENAIVRMLFVSFAGMLAIAYDSSMTVAKIPAVLLTGTISSIFAGDRNLQILLIYCIFLLTVEVVSFGIAVLVSNRKEVKNGFIEWIRAL